MLQGSTSIEEPGFVAVWNLLDILQYCGDRGMSRMIVRPGDYSDNSRIMLSTTCTPPY